jgi:2-phospho-L-lactate guanylyltransferase
MADLLAIVPCKGFRLGKSRLAPVLSDDRRAELCRGFLDGTLATLARLRAEVVVITADPEAAEVSRAGGARVLADRGSELNAALRTARAALAGQRCRVLVTPTDLPCADAAALGRLLALQADVVIAPDRAATGTNLLALSPAAFRTFPFSYGPDSFDRHLTAAAEGGWRTAVLRDPSLALDIDMPADLDHWRASTLDGCRSAA